MSRNSRAGMFVVRTAEITLSEYVELADWAAENCTGVLLSYRSIALADYAAMIRKIDTLNFVVAQQYVWCEREEDAALLKMRWGG